MQKRDLGLSLLSSSSLNITALNQVSEGTALNLDALILNIPSLDMREIKDNIYVERW